MARSTLVCGGVPRKLMICFKTNVGNIVEEFAMWAITACSYRHRSRISRVEPQLSMGNRVLGHPIEISMCKHDGIIGAHHLGCRRFRNTRDVEFVRLQTPVDFRFAHTRNPFIPSLRVAPHTHFSQSFPFTYSRSGNSCPHQLFFRSDVDVGRRRSVSNVSGILNKPYR